MRLYVIGPVSGFPENNRPAFERAASQLHRALGCAVEIPHDTVPSDADWQTAMRLSISAMLGCDGVALLEGWRWSQGARIERQLAVDIGMQTGSVPWWEATGGGTSGLQLP